MIRWSLTLIDEDLFGGSFTTQAFYNRSEDVFGGGIFANFQDPEFAPVNTLFDQSAERIEEAGREDHL